MLRSIFFVFLGGLHSAVVYAAYGSNISGAALGQGWSAINTHNEVISPRTMKGKVSLYFFGFTQCPDICPTTLARLSGIFPLLTEKEKSLFQAIFVSVDPERDTPKVLTQYLSYFKGNFVGVTGTVEQIKTIARSFGASYRKIPLGNKPIEEDYTMEHSANLYLFDKNGLPRFFYYGNTKPTHLANDIKYLLQE